MKNQWRGKNGPLWLLAVASLISLCSVGCSSSHSSTSKTLLAKDLSETPRVIYGADYRHEYFENQNSVLAHVAQATVALVNVDRISYPDATHTQINGPLVKQIRQYCEGERYLDQVAGADCSGFLAAPDVIVTAGHCAQRPYDCRMLKFVFGYVKHAVDDPGTVVDNSNVYDCKDLIHTQNLDIDFAVIRLSRPVVDRQPLAVRSSGAAAVGEALSAVGFPMGIPMKLVNGGIVRSTPSPAGTLNVALDLFKGNSGSPVVESSSGMVEGIVSNGEDDFKFQNGCYVSNICPLDGCRGETISLSSNFLPFLTPVPSLVRR